MTRLRAIATAVVCMGIGKTFYAPDAEKWRAWLERNHAEEKEIWLVYYTKGSGKPRVSYNDAVGEAICFGWIDSTAKKIDDEKFAQRFTPRRKNSPMSELNKERARRMITEGKMTKAGIGAISGGLGGRFAVPADIKAALMQNKAAWRNFRKFPLYYRRIRVAFIVGARNRPEEFQRRLNNFVRKTEQNKKFGMLQ